MTIADQVHAIATSVPVRVLGLPSRFIPQGSADRILAQLGLDADGIAATGADADGRISADDVRAINAWIQADEGRYNQFVALHGDDENGTETGFHLVQNEGATHN